MTAKCVLVVDDDEDHRDICVTILQHHRYEVTEAADGEEALRVVGDHRPDLILMDAMLPVLDGWAATARLKGSPDTASIPVVMITARAMDLDRERSFESGADSYIAKPCDPAQIVEEVRRLIGPPTASGPSGFLYPPQARPVKTTMDPPLRCTWERIEEVDPGDLASESLHYAAGRTAHPARVYRVEMATVDGPELLELLHFEATHRAGIAWRGCDWWLDASSAEEALRRWTAGEGRMSGSRTESTEQNER
jgi:CheY-like chemotaxis protein